MTTFATFVLTSFGASNAETDATIWVPSDVVLKEQYHGLIIVNSNTNSDTTFDVITDNSEVIQLITETVTVPAGKHHGIIQFMTVGTGNAKIYAISQDTLLETSIDVVESAATPISLELITPSNIVNVLTDDNIHTGYVFLINDFDNPVVATEPIPVTLTSSGEINLPKKSVTIEPGNHYTTFRFEAKGDGSLTASAPNLEPDDDTISVNDADEIELHIEIAPEPVPTDSSAEVYFWLERDERPYLAPHDIKISLSIDNSANLSFDSAIEGAIVLTADTADERRTQDPDARSVITRTEVQLALDSKREFTIKEGQYYGRAQVYSSFDSGDITISGLAESINPRADEEKITESDSLTITTEPSSFGSGTQTNVVAYPDPAYEKVEIIISSGSDDGPVIERLAETITVFTDKRLELTSISPSIPLDENYVIVEAKVIDYGTDVEIFAERNEAESDEITIITSGKYVRGPQLEITPLPVIYNREQDLFLVSSSHDKLTTIPDEDPKASLISITTRPSFPFEALRDSESVIVVKGTVAESLDDEPMIHVASNAETATEELEVYNPDRKMINAQYPPKAFPYESFPLIVHSNDLNDNLVKKSTLKISSIANLATVGDLVSINQTGKHDVIFYDKNSVPVKLTLTIGSATPPQVTQSSQSESEAASPAIFTYDVIVENGEGSGTYPEGQEITISAPAVIDDMFIIKKKLVGWENLPYKEPTVTFEVDDEIETAPIYQDDYAILMGIAGSAGAVGGIISIKKIKKKDNEDETTDEDQVLEDLLK